MPLEAHEGKFFLDGKEIRIISGAMHYFRVMPEYWKDRMLKMKACGLNTLETYVCWNLHEEIKGEFNFEGILDVRKYIQMAHEVGLLVLFRPGPYICAEWDFGGLPSWLLNDPNMKVRESYKPYLDAVDKFLAELFSHVVDLQHSKGGPIIAFQIENEYGSYGNDLEYKNFLKQKFEAAGLCELFFTSDNGVGIQRGEVPNTLITANFQEQEHGYLISEYLRNVKQPGMPFMVMEFWSGWFDHWGEKHHIWPKEAFEKVFRWILSNNGSVNFYMFHGGTNFGFMAGANEGLGATNEGNKQPYQADVTSYDYDAPISENGVLTEKWYLIRDILREMLPDQVPKKLPEPPKPIPTKSYGDVQINGYLPMQELLKFIKPLQSNKVLTMEKLDINNGGGQGYGMTLYRKKVTQGSKLKFPGTVRDRATVYINGEEKEVVDYLKQNQVVTMAIPSEGAELDILVENLGRVNYAEFKSPVLNDQRKGLHGLQIDGKDVTNVEIYPMEFRKEFWESVRTSQAWKTGTPPNKTANMLKATFKIEGDPCDTFLNMKKWTKGFVFVNGFNLGRYWNAGPQETLYLPAPLLKEGDNEILIFEHHQASSSIQFDEKASLGETIVHTTEISELLLPGVNA